MRLVTLVTDWGTKDHFVGAMKAKLYSHIQDIQVIDISHDIDPFYTSNAAFVVKNACLNFPPGTVHIIDIESVETNTNSHIIIEHNQQYYICTDNGLPSLVFPKDQIKAYQIKIYQDSYYFTFAAFDLFAKVAIELLNGTKPAALGNEMDTLVEKNLMNPDFKGDRLVASIIYVDHYGNAYLNIIDEEFDRYCNGRSFTLITRSTSQKDSIKKLSTSYNDVKEAELLLTISSTGHLQIAMNKGNASELVGLRLFSNVVFEFGEKETKLFS